MARLELDSVNVDIPIYDYSARKLLRSFNSSRRFDKSTNGRTTIRALQEISLELVDGDRVGVLGANGSGKTTLLRVLSGVYSPSSGTIKRSGGLGSLLDISFGIEPDLTGRESIRLRAKMLGISAEEVARNEQEIIDFAGLGSFIDLPTRTYSSGMFVRLAFSIATVLAPEILIMDEWLSVGDQDFKEKAEKRLEALVAQTKILVVATHSQELILKTCNRAILLSRGQIVAEGSPDVVSQRYFSSE